MPSIIFEIFLTPSLLAELKSSMNCGSSLLLLTLGTGVIIIISYGFFYLFERPFLTMGKQAKAADIEAETIKNPAP